MVIVLAGRRIDKEGATPPRFPLRQAAVVEKKLEAFFREHRPAAIVCSGACGADLLALEAAGKTGVRRRMILPFDGQRFRALSVTDRPGDWGDRYDRLYRELSLSNDVVVLDLEENEEGFLECNRAILDEGETLARMHGENGEGEGGEDGLTGLLALLVWDGSPKKGSDVTGAFGKEAIARGIKVEEISTLA